MNILIVVPIIVFVIVCLTLFMFSKDPDKKEKPINFILPGVIVSGISFFIMKYRDHFSQEPLMQGNYFD